MNVAVIPFLNCAPFYCTKSHLNPDSRSMHWVPLNPKEIGENIRLGRIDAGPVSLVDCFRIENDFEPLAGFGIVAPETVMSVLLFSKDPIDRLSGGTIGLTAQSVTSVELLKVLLRRKYGVEPAFAQGFDRGERARLLIGDDALKAAMDDGFGREFPVKMDLGAEWRAWKGLPFVFARWMVRKALPAEQKAELTAFLERNLALSEKDHRIAADWHFAESGWNYPHAVEYLSSLRYRLGAEEDRSIELFRGLLLERPSPVL